MTGYVIKFGDFPVSKVKKQYTVSKNLAKAKYRSMASVVVEIMCLIGVLKELNVDVNTPVVLHCDNKTTM